MKDMEELKNAKAEDFYYIGKRLREIRDDLVEADETTDKRNSFYSRKNVGDRLGIDYSTLTNLERGTISPTTFKLFVGL
jgi:transcriptional regulator with XRE-family HTH domain